MPDVDPFEIAPQGVSRLNQSGRFLADLERIVRSLQELVRRASPGSASGEQATRAAALFAETERAASSGLALFTPVVVETGSYAKAGHGSAADWLGSLAGSSPGAAKGRLWAAERAARTPELSGALHGGALSSAQLELLSRASAEAPEATAGLVSMAQDGASHKELRSAADRLVAAARSKETEQLRRARIHARRHLRWHQEAGGGIRGEFLCDEVAWAHVFPRLEKETSRRWKAVGAKDGQTRDALRLDAFLDLLASSNSGGTKGAPAEVIVVIDAAALRRGVTKGDEMCEIEGVGPVPVSTATDLLGEGALRYVVREGFDIKAVTKPTRDIAACIEAALLVRDRTCVVAHCGNRHGLERDHVRIDYADDGPTELDNLVRICPEHHALKTYGGWRIEGEPGRWKWVAPANPKSASAITRARKLAATKAKAGIMGDRNKPRRT